MTSIDQLIEEYRDLHELCCLLTDLLRLSRDDVRSWMRAQACLREIECQKMTVGWRILEHLVR